MAGMEEVGSIVTGMHYDAAHKISNNETLTFSNEFGNIEVTFMSEIDIYGYSLEAIGNDDEVGLVLFLESKPSTDDPIWNVEYGNEYTYNCDEGHQLKHLGQVVEQASHDDLYANQ